MALLKAISNGNFTDASTWALCTAVVDTNTATSATTTSYQYSNQVASTVTANATGVLIKIGSIPTVSGTISVALATGGSVNLAECTMNISDIAAGIPTTGTTHGYWIFFKFNTPVAIVNTTFYRVGIKATSTVNFWRGAAATSPSMAIVTDATQAPASTDRFIIVGDNNADATNPGVTAGTKGSSYSVVMNNTNNTQFGDGTGVTTASGSATWGLWVGDYGTLSYGNSGGINYYLRMRGNIGIGANGTINIGTLASPIPRNSTATLEIDAAATGNHFLSLQGGNLNAYGLSRTAGKDVDRCLLSADSAAGATTLTVDTDTGWLANDTIFVSPSTRVAGTGSQERTLSVNATSNTLTLVAGVTAARDGNSTIQTSIMLTTRNVVIKGTTSALTFWGEVRGNSRLNMEWAKVFSCGNSTTGKNGINLLTNDPSYVSISRCNFDSSYTPFVCNQATSGALIDNCTFTASGSIAYAACSASSTFTNCWICNTVNISAVSIRNLFIINNLRISGSLANGIGFTTINASDSSTPFTIDNLYIHSCSAGIGGSYASSRLNQLIINNLFIQRCATSGIGITTCHNLTIDNFTLWGNANNIQSPQHSDNYILRNGYIAGQSGNASVSGIITNFGPSTGFMTFENCTFGSGFTGASTHGTADINDQSSATLSFKIFFRNCLFSSTTLVAPIVNENTLIISEAHEQVAGDKFIQSAFGIVRTDSSISRSGGSSIRLTPSPASSKKLEYLFAKTAVSGGTTPTIGVYIRKSVAGDGSAYNGNQPRLIVRRNILLGISSDTVISTATAASNGSWELLTGQLPLLTNNGIVEIEIDCDGTAGFINIDDFQSPTAVNTKSFSVSDDTLGVIAYGDNSSGGGLLIGPSILVS